MQGYSISSQVDPAALTRPAHPPGLVSREWIERCACSDGRPLDGRVGLAGALGALACRTHGGLETRRPQGLVRASGHLGRPVRRVGLGLPGAPSPCGLRRCSLRMAGCSAGAPGFDGGGPQSFLAQCGRAGAGVADRRAVVDRRGRVGYWWWRRTFINRKSRGLKSRPGGWWSCRCRQLRIWNSRRFIRGHPGHCRTVVASCPVLLQAPLLQVHEQQRDGRGRDPRHP